MDFAYHVGNDNRNRQHVLNADYAPGIELAMLYVLSHLIFSTAEEGILLGLSFR